MHLHLLNNKLPGKNNDNINTLIKNNDILMLYYADWCGHCTTFKPIWNDLIEKIQNGETTKIITVISIENEDLQKDENSNLKSQVQGFPTIKFYNKGNLTDGKLYEKKRTIDELINFINLHGKTNKSTQTTKSKPNKLLKGSYKTKKAKKIKNLKTKKPKVKDTETVKYTKKAIAKIHKELKKSKSISQKLIKDMKKELKL